MTESLATNLNFTRLCRCCTVERDLMYDIFCGTCSNAQTYYEVVMECAPVQVFKDDGLTSLVCHECVLILESFVMFRRKCVESETILKHMRYNMIPDRPEMFDLNRVKQDDPILDNIKEESDDIDATIEPETEFDDPGKNPASGKYPELHLYDEIKNESPTLNENRPDTNRQIDSQRLYVNFVDVKEELVDHDWSERPYFNTDRNETKSNTSDSYDRSFSCETNFYKREKTRTGDKPYSCGQCDKLFKFKSNLHRHQKIHSYRYSCDTCKKTFQCKSKLGLHQRTHTGEKPYPCDKCDKSYNCRSQLNEHLKLHSGEKPYSCDKCEKSFSIRTLLNRHQTIHTGEKPYTCDRCDKSFNFKWNLVRHQRVHTGEKPYSCDQCDKLFNCKSHLNEHTIIHTNEKPYSCDRCDKSFNFKSNFNKHRKQHMAETVPARETIQP